jgi:hypothetical protein
MLMLREIRCWLRAAEWRQTKASVYAVDQHVALFGERKRCFKASRIWASNFDLQRCSSMDREREAQLENRACKIHKGVGFVIGGWHSRKPTAVVPKRGFRSAESQDGDDADFANANAPHWVRPV